MSHVFSDLEGLRIAVEMERRGEAFYRRAAKISKSAETVALLESLAEDEQRHNAEFTRLYNEECERIENSKCDHAYDPETSAYLSAIAAEIIFPGGLMALRQTGFEDPEAVLLDAIASEKDSILFYTELAQRTHNDHARDVFNEITRQERNHMTWLMRRLDMLKNNPQ
ncbi:MAG: hypothetical protein E7337_05940 [Clostridiales bacterium]|nr:hypothetical protein [Clostridiales bacterium]